MINQTTQQPDKTKKHNQIIPTMQTKNATRETQPNTSIILVPIPLMNNYPCRQTNFLFDFIFLKEKKKNVSPFPIPLHQITKNLPRKKKNTFTRLFFSTKLTKRK